MDCKTVLILFFISSFVFLPNSCNSTGFFEVKRKFSSNRGFLDYLKSHDNRRHRRILGAVDLPLGGIGQPSVAGLYFAQIALGTPSKKYYVQVDTGSDILWVNCAECKHCPTKSDLGIELTLYDPMASKTGSLVSCGHTFCSSQYESQIQNCNPQLPCPYGVNYGDGSSTSGYFVQDILHYNQASGSGQTRTANASIFFGCGAQQSGDLGSSDEAVDGIFGFGQSNSSVISQLASSGKVRKSFAHCLDGVNGGGIFVIGHVVQPTVKTTPMVPNLQHYNVNLKAIDVGEAVVRVPSDGVGTESRTGAIIDSGTTLAYVPEAVYTPLIDAIMSYQPDVRLHLLRDFQCFQYTERVDDGFPVVRLRFENDLSLTVYPHEYFFQINDEAWCIGWQNSGMQSKDGKDVTLLGDLVLSNKLVVYDLEQQTVGWTEYNCSSSVKVQDDKTKSIFTVQAHDLSSADHLTRKCIVVFLILAAAVVI